MTLSCSSVLTYMSIDLHVFPQILKDVIAVSEMTGWSGQASSLSKYRALGCHIHKLTDSQEVNRIRKLVLDSQRE